MDCKEAYPFDIEKLKPSEKKLFEGYQLPKQLYKGKGCNKCNASGFYDRTGVFEIVPFDEDIKLHIIEQKPVSEIQAMYQKKRIRRLRESTLAKVYQGITTYGEVIRVIRAS